jgi:hypothetical protein
MLQGTHQSVIYTYRVKAECEEALLGLLGLQWPLLLKRHLVTDVPPLTYRGLDQFKRPLVVEVFTWESRRAIGLARECEEILALWKRIDACLEARDAQPPREAQEVEPMAISGHKVVRIL